MSKETEGKTTVLLADDYHIVRQGIRRLLEREADIDVIGEAEDGQEALKLARDLKPDVIILEARLPKLDSPEAIKRIKAEHPERVVIILTSHEEEEYFIDLLRAGADGYLLKNTKGEELVQSIRMVRSGQFICDPQAERKLLKHAGRMYPVTLDFGEHLTRREIQVLALATKHMSNREIADYLGLTEGTIKGYFVSIFSKMGVGSRTEAVLEALKRGWVSLEDKVG